MFNKASSVEVDKKKRVKMPTLEEMAESGIYVGGKNLLVYRIYPKQVSKGGIIVPPSAHENHEENYPHTGVVMQVGYELQWEDALNMHPDKSKQGQVIQKNPKYAYGDFVWYSQFASKFVKDEATGVEYMCINENDIFMLKRGFTGYDEHGYLINVEDEK